MSEQSRELIAIFEAIADGLDVQGENPHRVMAYRRAVDHLRALGEPLEHIWHEGRLETISGIGSTLVAKIDEYYRTGKVAAHQRLQDQVPLGLLTILNIPGMGPRRTRLFWDEMGITSVEDLEGAASAGQLRKVKGVGPSTEQKILDGIRAWRRQRAERIPLGVAWPLAQEILGSLREMPGVYAAEPAGSLRRKRETVGDLELLAAADASEPVMARFRALPIVSDVVLSGSTKTAICTMDGIHVDLRVVSPRCWGSALQYFTGSQAHNVRVRALAQEQGLSLSEYGFRRIREGDIVASDILCSVSSGADIVCAEEAQVYATLGLPWIPPELREDRGEVAAARENRLPSLVTRHDLLGDFQCHTTFSDGDDDLETMARAAYAAGLHYLIVGDHVGRDGVRLGEIDGYLAEIARVNDQYAGDFRLLSGVEVGIRAGGSLDWPDEALARMDMVIASCHNDYNLPKAQMTARMVTAMRNPYVDVIGHPTGRLLGRRESVDLDMAALFNSALEYGVALEINAWPQRLDLNDVYVRRACALGIPLAISSAAHDREGFAVLEFGVAVARRGWCEPRHLLNTRSADELLAWRAHRRARFGL